MCLTTEALALFLNLLATDIVTTEPDRIVVHATEGDVHWLAVEDRWCTAAPQQDDTAKLAPGR